MKTYRIVFLLLPTILLAEQATLAPVTPQKRVASSSSSVSSKPEKPQSIKPSKKQKRRAKRKKRGEMKDKVSKKTLRDMNYEELKAAKDRVLKAGDKAIATKYLEKMVPMCNDLEELRANMLELSDLFFDTGELEKAGKMYKEFTTMYPGSNFVEYSLYKAILCSFYATLDCERDQTKTRDTIELADSFLQRSAIFVTYTKEVGDILGKCRQRLFDSEVNIFNFYLHRGSFRSAQKRLATIEKEFLPIMPQVEVKLCTLACNLAEKQGAPMYEQKQAVFKQKFPDQYALFVAEKEKQKKSFLGRF